MYVANKSRNLNLYSENEDVVGSVVVDDYSIEESTDNCLDYFCIATK